MITFIRTKKEQQKALIKKIIKDKERELTKCREDKNIYKIHFGKESLSFDLINTLINEKQFIINLLKNLIGDI